MSTETIARAVRDAAASATPRRVASGGNWLRAGAPVTATQTLSVAQERGIVEYVPGDLTLTARAGTPIAELVAAVKAHEQWLPLDPWGGDHGTLGATISTATAGPHSHAMGLARDVTLGLEFVTGTGETVRSGGRVVKNVAGFDLTRLLIGSWGTLGVITEVTVRLRARPATLRAFMIPVNGGRDAVKRIASQVRALPFTPLAAELVDGALATKLGVGATPTLLLRVGGNTNAVNAQIAALRTLGEGGTRLAEAPADIWQRLRAADRDAHASWRRSQLPSDFAELWTNAKRESDSRVTTWMHGSPLRGVVRVLATGDEPAIELAMRDGPGTLAPEVAPRSFTGTVSPDRLRVAALERKLRSTFDPKGILNPGILGAGA